MYKQHVNNISKAMKKFYDTSQLNLETAISIIKTIENDLLEILSDTQFRDGDWRLGTDTYGYEPGSILPNLQYISDRWNCAFRIAWMLGLVNENYR